MKDLHSLVPEPRSVSLRHFIEKRCYGLLLWCCAAHSRYPFATLYLFRSILIPPYPYFAVSLYVSIYCIPIPLYLYTALSLYRSILIPLPPPAPPAVSVYRIAGRWSLLVCSKRLLDYACFHKEDLKEADRDRDNQHSSTNKGHSHHEHQHEHAHLLGGMDTSDFAVFSHKVSCEARFLDKYNTCRVTGYSFVEF